MTTNPLHDKRVIIADPNEDSANLTATLCHNIGVLEVVTAHDPRELIAKLEHHNFDLLVASHRFPPKGSVHLAQLLKGAKKSPARDIPIIMLAGSVTKDEVLAVRKLKDCLILLRPLSTKGFMDHVFKLMQLEAPE